MRTSYEAPHPPQIYPLPPALNTMIQSTVFDMKHFTIHVIFNEIQGKLIYGSVQRITQLYVHVLN